MAQIAESFIQDVLLQTSLVEVISQVVPLKKAGRNHQACCPFHNEKTPSFSVSSDKNLYHCFGCGASGNALNFLMQYHNLSFIDALERLATPLGMKLPISEQAQHESQIKVTLNQVAEQAASFYQRALRKIYDNEASEAPIKSYLKGREISAESMKSFKIGFAEPGWHHLENFAREQKISLKDLAQLGFLGHKEDKDKYYDIFRNRLILPIQNHKGEVVAIGGRVLSKEDKPKYLNSQESPLFHKSQTLYGLYQALQANRKPERLIVAEGYLDVIAIHQAGIPQAVATLGTACTEDHVKILFRYTNEIIFAFAGSIGQFGFNQSFVAAIGHVLYQRFKPCNELGFGVYGIRIVLICVFEQVI
jgi:DNA primase